MSSRVTKELIQEALKRDDITSFHVEKGLFSCFEQYEVDVTQGGVSRPLMVKLSKGITCNKEHDHAEPSMECDGNLVKMFQKELKVWTSWIPELEKFLADKPEHKLSLAPLISLKDNGEDSWLVYESLKARGYKKNPSPQLDFSQCALVVSELAKMHAGSWAYKQKKGVSSLISKFPFLEETLHVEPGRGMFEGMLGATLERAKLTIAKSEGENSPLIKEVDKLTPKALFDNLLTFANQSDLVKKMEKLEGILKKRSFTPSEIANKESWMVQCHSDLWTHNIMFHHDEKTGKVDKLYLNDFFFANETCPMNELAYFIYLSTDHHLRKRLPELLRIYHEQFLSVCKGFGVTPPQDFENFEHLCKRFRTARVFGFTSALVWFPCIFEWDTFGNCPPKEEGKEEEKKPGPWEEKGPCEGFKGEWLVGLFKEIVADELI